MTISNVKNNGTDGLPADLSLIVNDDEDAGPFVYLVLEDASSGMSLMDVFIEDEESVDDLLRDVTRAVDGFKKRTARA